MTRMTSWIPSALLAGLVGGIAVELYLFAVGLATWPSVYQWIASTLVGPQAFDALGYAWLGLALHAAVSIGWALAYGYAASRVSAIGARPVGAGLVFGVLVYGAMQALLAVNGSFTAPTPAGLAHGLISHAVFFGLPVALVAGRRERPADAAGTARRAAA